MSSDRSNNLEKFNFVFVYQDSQESQLLSLVLHQLRLSDRDNVQTLEICHELSRKNCNAV